MNLLLTSLTNQVFGNGIHHGVEGVRNVITMGFEGANFGPGANSLGQINIIKYPLDPFDLDQNLPKFSSDSHQRSGRTRSTRV